MSWAFKKTAIIFGKPHSTALLSLLFVSALVGCTSSVLFMPYMRNYREIYLVSYLVGEGLSGFLPSIVALIQGVGGNGKCRNITSPGSTELKFEEYHPPPRFSLATFFLFVGTILLTSFLSFVGLNNLRVARQERVKLPSSAEILSTEMNAPPSYKTNSGWSMPRTLYVYLLVMMSVVCLLGNGILPSIQSYSCLPYGNVAYHLTVTLASMASPLAMCLGFFIKTPKISLLSFLFTIVLVLSGGIFYLAIKSPTPPLQNSIPGTLMTVCLWIAVSGLSGFIKMGITTLFRPDPGKGLYFTGVATQLGSLFGAMISFALVEYVNLFEAYNICTAQVH